jgi:hypothetical protein
MQQIRSKELASNHPFKVSTHVVLDIWYTLNQAALDKIIESGGEYFKFYGRFGQLGIDRCKRKIKIIDGKPNLRVNIVKTLKLRREGKLAPDKFAYNMFEYTYSFVLRRKKFKYSSTYMYKASRSNGQKSMSGAINKLWKFITENPTNYLKFPLKS